jgi:hypothetical protein
MANADLRPLESFKEAHEIGREFKRIYNLLQTGTSDAYGLTPYKVNYTEPDGTIKASLINYFSQTFEDGLQEYYIRFGAFLSFLNAKIIPNIDYKNDNKLINIDTNIIGNIMYTQPYTFSVDPKVCYVKREYTLDNILYNFIPSASDFIVDFNGATNIVGKYGNVMNIYFNMEWILGKIDEIKDNKGKISLYGLLDTLCKGYNESTGNFNKLEPVIDTETNTIKILDDVALPDRNAILESNYITDVYGKISTEDVIFDTYKYNLGIKGSIYGENVPHAGFIKDLSFNTSVSPELATMITVGSTKQGYIKGADATSLSRMNNGLTDRFKEQITNADEIENEPPQPLRVQYKAAIISFNFLIKQLGTNSTKKLPIYDEDAIQDFKNLQTQLIEYFQYVEVEKNRLQNPDASSANSGFLPFDLSLKMDGLSGMKVYQKFTIDTDFLPTNYPGALEFLIKGITHNIAGNEWTTSIESMAIPKNPFAVNSSIEEERSNNREEIQEFSAVLGNNLPILPGNYITDRDNNPFNLRPLRGSNQFNGSIGKKEGFNNGSSIGYFTVFDTLENGVRAGMKNLSTYFTKYRRDTISKIINAYAPGGTPGQSSSRTSNYVDLITTYMKTNYSSSITSSTKLTFNGAAETNQNNIKMFKTLVKGILNQEGGLNPRVETLITNFIISSLR